MGVNDYGQPSDLLKAPSLSEWAASVAAALDGDDTTVDARLAALEAIVDAAKVNRSGDSMTGPLTIADSAHLSSRAVVGVESLKALNGVLYTRPTPEATIGAARVVVADPVGADEAASKGYVDGRLVPPGFVVPTLANGWGIYGGGHLWPAYTKDAMGFVHLQGMVLGGTTGQPVFTLPAGYRPIGRFEQITYAYPGYAVLGIDTLGNVTVGAYFNGGTNGAVAFNGITFPTF
jgi:hypothetical protein